MYPGKGLSFFSTITKNRFLFWAVVAGLVTPFPIIYIPVVNRVVFRHRALTWEWGLVFGSVLLFVAVVEGWKCGKRYRKAKSAKKNGGAHAEKVSV